MLEAVWCNIVSNFVTYGSSMCGVTCRSPYVLLSPFVQSFCVVLAETYIIVYYLETMASAVDSNA